jgi:tetratricopeptide (TPR) repeat protein
MHQYYPLTATSFWVDYHLWGFWTVPYHVENVLLHILSALLLWRLLRRLDVPGALFAVSVFALHPIMVESVAWITERKNVLSMVLFLCALLSFDRFKPFREAGGSPTMAKAPKEWRWYVAALLLFLAAYLAKATVFAFPAVLVLISWWQRGAFARRDIWPSVPFLGLAFALGLFTSWVEQSPLGATGSEFDLPFCSRCLIAGRAVWFYLGKLLWPNSLCFNYPRWHIDPAAPDQWLWPVGVIAALACLWFLRNRFGRGPLAAALFFIGTAFPLLGFVTAYYYRYSYVADHWVYLPSLALLAVLGAAGATAARAQHFSRKATLTCSSVVLLALGGLTWQQAANYHDDETLWRDTVVKNPASWMGWTYLGAYAQERNALDRATQYYRRSIGIYPSFEAYHRLGNVLLLQGHPDEAISQIRNSIELRPDVSAVHQDLGIALARQGLMEQAMAEYRKAIELGPKRAYPHFCLGTAFERLGRTKEAMTEYREAAQLGPNLAEPLRNLATLLASDPNPQLRSGAEAIGFGERACELTSYRDHLCVSTLAMAYAEGGRWDQAVGMAQKAVNLAEIAGDTESASDYRKLAEQFLKGNPYRSVPKSQP